MLTPAETKAFQKRLQKLVGQVDEVRSELAREIHTDEPEEAEYTGDPRDQRGHLTDTEVALESLAIEEGIESEIRHALDRIAAGTFGRCEACGKAVAKPRLDAIPYARHCLACAEAKG